MRLHFILIFGLILQPCLAQAFKLDAYSGVQFGLADGKYNIAGVANQKMGENVLGATAGLMFGSIGAGIHGEYSYTDAGVPTDYNPIATGAVYPIPTGHSMRYGLQARMEIDRFEVLGSYFPAAQYAGSFKFAGSTYTYAYDGGGYRLDVGFQFSRTIWLRLGYAMYEMKTGKSGLNPDAGTFSLDHKLSVQEVMLSVSIFCSWRNKCRGK